MERIQFTVRWPLQGAACFRSPETELILSDVYWRWVYEALRRGGSEGHRLGFVQAVELGFCDASNLREIIPVDQALLKQLSAVESSDAPSFDRVQPSQDCVVPTAARVLEVFQRVAREATRLGTLEMEIE